MEKYLVASSGCAVYLCRNMSVLEAIKKVENGDVPSLKEPTLKDSIHSARKTGDRYSGRGEGRVTGRWLGIGSRAGKGMGKGMRSGRGTGSRG